MALTQAEINEVMQQLQPIIAKALNESTSISQAQANIQQGVTQYIGARYVPLFADPIEWNNARAYEPLTIVLYQGNSFTTRQYTPAGIEITNEAFWAETGNYNAQVEQYKQAVSTFDGRITALESEMPSKVDKETVLLIGNSYTVGYNSTSEQNSLRYNLNDLFGTVYAYGEPAAGFIKHYADAHDVSFYEMLNTWANGTWHGSSPDKITRIIFNIAVGDSNAYAKNSTDYINKLNGAVKACLDVIAARYPNVKHVGVMYMDSLFTSKRVFTDTDGTSYDVTLRHMSELYRVYRPYFVNSYLMEFYGWCGWSLIGTHFMNNADNIHPTEIDGYKAMVNAWKNAYLGNLDWRCIFSRVELKIDGKTIPLNIYAKDPNLMTLGVEFKALGEYTPSAKTFQLEQELPPLASTGFSSRFYLFNSTLSLMLQLVFSDKLYAYIDFYDTEPKNFTYTQEQLLSPIVKGEATQR